MVSEDARTFRVTYVLGGAVELVWFLIEAFSQVVDLRRSALEFDFHGAFENIDERRSWMPMPSADGARSKRDFSDGQPDISTGIRAPFTWNISGCW